jgi:hypothetical protein
MPRSPSVRAPAPDTVTTDRPHGVAAELVERRLLAA